MAGQTRSDPSPTREHERDLELFGTRVRLLASGPGAGPDPISPEVALDELEEILHEMHSRLTRFDPRSELAALNAADRETFEASEYLVVAVQAALEAAELSGGLVDPVMVDALTVAGYGDSKAGQEPASLEAAIAHAPSRSPARARAESPWREISVDAEAGSVTKPVGVRIDLGGIGKGLAADLAATRLSGYPSWCADIGGDLRMGGVAGAEREVGVTNPLTGEVGARFHLAQGAVATSGISRRVWQVDGSENGAEVFSHHLLDPESGLPAWTGVIQATAISGSAREAETLAKMALLSGPVRGAEILSQGDGGLLVFDSGEIEALGPLAERVEATTGEIPDPAVVTG